MTNNFLTKSAVIRLQITKARIRLIVASGITGGRSRAQRFRINMKRAVNSRVLATVTLQFWALPLLIALYTFTTQTSQWVYFAVVSFE